MFGMGSSRLGHWLTSLMVDWLTPTRMDRAIASASHQLGVDLDHVDTGPAVAATWACTLIVHGAHDRLMSAAAFRRLSRKSKRAAYINIGDLGLPIRADWLFRPITAAAGIAGGRQRNVPRVGVAH